ncbi:MAG: glycosyltransferase [Aquificaceae bacterium]
MLRKLKEKYKTYKASKKQFSLDGVIDGVIFGWVVSEKEPELEVHINGKKVHIPNSAIVKLPAPEIHPEALRFGIDLKEVGHVNENDVVLLFINGKKLKKTPITLTKSLCFGRIDGFAGCECFGWSGTPFGPLLDLEVVVDNEPQKVNLEWFIREDFKKLGISIPTGFKFKIPEKYLDGKFHTLYIKNRLSNKPIHKEKTFRFYVKNFYIDKADTEAIAGWIQIGDYPGAIDLDIYINNKKFGSVEANFIREDAEKEHGIGCYGFYYAFTENDKILLGDSYDFSIYLKDTNIKIIDSHKTISVADVIEGLEKVAQSLKEKNDRILRPYLKTAIGLIRANIPKNVNRFIYKDVVDVVDVIIPVYKAKKQTIECIESVLKAKTNVKHEVIVINDCTPEEDLRRELLEYAKKGKITLIENRENLGFVKSVNIGMKLHKNRDVVLLNSDTLVPDFWLDRLRRAAYSSMNIGTVTPFSNRATILSLPMSNLDNDIPDGFDYVKIDNICQRVNEGITIDIPTAIGFCMYIKRECLNEVGYFDEEKFDKGYGEENDFCMRASSLGWRHVACLDLFVQHHGNLSFGEEKPMRVRKALEVINNLYPEYNLRVQKFVKRDPIAPYRNRVIKELFKEKYKSFGVFIIHNWGGGSFKYCKDMSLLLAKDGIGSLFIQPQDRSILIYLQEPEDKEGKTLALQFPKYLPMEEIFKELKDLPVIFVHYNQTIGFKDLSIWDIPKILEVPYFVTLHDYFYICPRIHLVNSGNAFCGVPGIETCEACLSYGSLQEEIDKLFKKEFNSSIQDWISFYRERLKGARKVIAPTETAKSYINKVFNLDNVEAIPHPEKGVEVEIKKPKDVSKLKIAIIGAIGEHKGYFQYLRLIDYSHRNALPFEFIFFGYTRDNKSLKRYPNLLITGPYKDEKELYNLVRAYNPHIALFLHIWPETYTYTLSEALRLGLYPVSYDIGAPAERLRKLKVGTLIPFPSPIQKIADILMELLKTEWESKKISIGREYGSLIEEYYNFKEYKEV